MPLHEASMSSTLSTSVLPAAPAPGGIPANLPARLRALRDGLLTGLVERDVAVRLALIAALAGEHLLLLGPPGTAKSLVARRLHLAFDQASYFERLLTRFTVPEELFGPLSIKGLEEDRYERLTGAYLPTASIAFLDEIFKANSAILNALLTLLNEREFDNGVNRESTPLIAVIGASNEMPEGEELHALFDRFLLRLHVGPVSKEAFPSLLGLRGEPKPAAIEAHRLSMDELKAVQQAAQSVAVPDDVVALLCDLRDWCTAEAIAVSDRRWRKVVKLLQVSALTNGRDRVSIWDCWLLQYCLWNDPETREKVYDWYAARVGASAAMDPSRLTRIVVSWEGRLKQDQDSRSQVRDAQGRLLFEGHDGKAEFSKSGSTQARRGGVPLYFAPSDARQRPDNWHWEVVGDRTNGGKGFTDDELDQMQVRDPGQGFQDFKYWPNREAYLANATNWLMKDVDYRPLMEPTRQKAAYVDASLAEIDAICEQVEAYKVKLVEHIAGLEAAIRSHIWVTADFAEPASQSLDGTRREVDTLLTRIDKLRSGFEMLPRDFPAPPHDDGDAVADQPAPKSKEEGRK
jgi:MoxR-like ATPase